MKRTKKHKALNWIIGVLVIALVVGVLAYTQAFTVVPQGQTVWIPDYGTVACKQTRLECSGGACSDTNPTFTSIPNGGMSLWCGAPTLSDANYYDGCDVYLKTDGNSFNANIDASICNGDGTQCMIAQATGGSLGNTPFSSGVAKSYHVPSGKKLFVNPYTVIPFTTAPWSYYMQAHVYGLAIEGAVKPKYADRCNIAQLLGDKQIATLKDSPDYIKTINAGEINPGNFPIVFVTGYKASYSDQRVIERNGESWFIEDIGTRCKVEQDSNSRYIVTDKCVEDTSIECFPNIANCDKDGKLLSVTGQDALEKKACVPGTLIGSSTNRVPISASQACKLKCSSNGVPQNFDCVDIPKCSDGKVLSQNYDCVTSTKLTQKEACEAGGGKYVETKDKDGNVTASCDYSPNDNTILYIIIAAVILVMLMIAVKMRMQK